MPSPGTSALAAMLGVKSYTVEGNYTTNFNPGGEFVSKLAAAMHTGWTSSSPATGTTMTGAFGAAFNGYLAGTGLLFMNSIAQGIDEDIAAWAASWDGNSHGYVVSVSSLMTRILALSPILSNGVQAITEAVATAFMSGFGQETG
ncbi:MAG: hypothetical protein OEZ39_07465 [Gammaproteobacteria bacterium]|nr:hypothetical protein [Gammaproteobacteria bacterium]MDH5651696.1 hypothetical protein [Gammaproteobacteria bacterium]